MTHTGTLTHSAESEKIGCGCHGIDWIRETQFASQHRIQVSDEHLKKTSVLEG